MKTKSLQPGGPTRTLKDPKGQNNGEKLKNNMKESLKEFNYIFEDNWKLKTIP